MSYLNSSVSGLRKERSAGVTSSEGKGAGRGYRRHDLVADQRRTGPKPAAFMLYGRADALDFADDGKAGRAEKRMNAAMFLALAIGMTGMIGMCRPVAGRVVRRVLAHHGRDMQRRGHHRRPAGERSRDEREDKQEPSHLQNLGRLGGEEKPPAPFLAPGRFRAAHRSPPLPHPAQSAREATRMYSQKFRASR